MKILIYTLITIGVIIALVFIALSVYSRKQPELGLVLGQLRACPGTPNCVSSEAESAAESVEPLSFSSNTEQAWSLARQAILEAGGRIVTEEGGYLHAYFVTPLMRYVDDVELRLDKEAGQIHIRSASRTGRSDFGANRKRVQRIRALYIKLQGEENV